MMAAKARLFDDAEAERKALTASGPALAKKAGRLVRKFDEAVWERERTWEVSNDTIPGEADSANSYVLEMLPYPSGEPHIGHLKCYAVGDAIAHFHRRLGRRVLHPMGYDSFGLPAENHAIRTGVHPRVSIAESIASFQQQFRSWGISIRNSWRS